MSNNSPMVTADEGEHGRIRWSAAALCLGFNELAKLGKTLGEKVYFRMMREASEKHFMELGGQRVFQQEPHVLTLTIEDGMPFIAFREQDIELMRETVAEWDKSQMLARKEST